MFAVGSAAMCTRIGDDFDQDYLDEASSVTCPDILIVREDGVWEFGKSEGS